jgi:hypothetical protein
MKKLFDINEDEKNRILEMHVSATKRHYLNEQAAPTPRTPGVVNQPSGTIGFTEVAGSASMVPIVSASVLTNIGVPATPDNFNNTFFYTDKNGLSKASTAKNLGTFSMTSPRTTKSADNVVAKYDDGSEIKLEGSGTKEFLTKGLKFIGGAGNGLLALQRALFSGTGKLPSKIKITLSGGMEGSSYKYDSAKVNETTSSFNQLLAHFIKPLVDPTKVSATYPFKDIVTGNAKSYETIPNILDRLLATFVPKPFVENKEKYGLDMTPDNFVQLINASAELSELDTKWNEIQTKIVAKYKENLDKFLTVKFPQNKDAYLSKFNPKTSSDTAKNELNDISSTYGPGYSTPRKSPTETQKSQQFKIGQGQ